MTCLRPPHWAASGVGRWVCVYNSDLGVAEDRGELLRIHGRVAVDRDWRVAGASQLFSYRGGGLVGVYKNSSHRTLLLRSPT